MAQSETQKKRQKVLIGILIAIVIIAVAFWYINQREEDEVSVESADFVDLEMPGQTDESFSLKEIKIDFSILDDELFKSLRSYGILPVKAGETGRINPFEPY